MATSFGAATASAAASVTENARKSSASLPLSHRHLLLRSNSLSFRLTPRAKLCFSSKSGWNCSLVKAQLNNKVAVDGSSKAAASTSAKDVEEPKQAALASEETISEFVSQVASLVKLVDSKDIVELHLKQLDCEVLIRKKEALPPPPSPPVTYYQSQPQPATLQLMSSRGDWALGKVLFLYTLSSAIENVRITNVPISTLLIGLWERVNLGQNAVLAVSMATSRAGAAEKEVPLYKHIADLAGKTSYHLPVPVFTLISGGNYAGNNLAIEEEGLES